MATLDILDKAALDKMEWHAIPEADVSELLRTDLQQGLTTLEAERRLAEFGPNELTRHSARGPLMTFLLQFHQPLVYILLTAAVVTAAMEELVDAGVIFGVVLVNAIVGFIQEYRAAKAIDALARSMSVTATVIRDGQKRRLPAQQLVPGDLVILQSGDQVPADLRLTRVRELRVAEAALTGESVPVEKAIGAMPAETSLGDRKNMAFATALVTYGQANGIVVATGDRTEVGKIQGMIQTAEELATPLTREIARFSTWLMYVILGLAGFTFIVGKLQGQATVDLFHAAVALAVAAIPEGLPAAVTIVLAIGVWRMARRNAIIRKLPAVEALGSTSVICSDKTGTLTKNEMTVQQIYAAGRTYEVTGSGYEPVGEIRHAGFDESLSEEALETLRCGLLCNDSQLLQKDSRWEIHGDPTEGALLVSARKAGLDQEQMNQEFRRIDTIPFESEHQYMVTLHHPRAGGPAIAYMKGSVERVLERCRGVNAEEIHAIALGMGELGLRVLAFAKKEFPAGTERIRHEDVAEGLTFLGLQGMIDPPRPEAIRAVAACHTAGIRVKMITGDHPATAAAIAVQLGLGHPDGPEGSPPVLTGQLLSQISDEALPDAAESVDVFARVSPEQKLRLVKALQARGRVIAMTGDGVNDAPALKQADIGVAMGITGTDVAKDAADMVLTDDNFASIEAAVEEGRGVFDNLTKFLVWTLPTNLGEGLVILVSVLVGATLPILPVQILWINMTTAVLLGMTLTFEPKEPDLMQRPPRPVGTSFIDAEMLRRMILVGLAMLAGAFGLFQWELASGASEATARTVAVHVFVMVELMYLFNCRHLRQTVLQSHFWGNPWAFVGAGVMILLQLALMYLPFMNRAFHTEPISTLAWLKVTSLALIVFLVVEVETWWISRDDRKSPEPTLP
jgi:cation-transporting ATPase F